MAEYTPNPASSQDTGDETRPSLVTRDEKALESGELAALRIQLVADAGAALVALLVAEINRHANAVASFICSQPGATAPLPETLLPLT